LVFENQFVQQRLEKAEQLRELGVNPYANDVDRDIRTDEFKEQFAYVSELENGRDEGQSRTIVGRIKFLRHMGKAAFAKVEDQRGILQIYFSRDEIGAEWFKSVKKLVEVGDIVQATGYPFTTKTGELSLHVSELKLMTKTVSPLPEKFHGLTDKELRYRQRYLDMIMNAEVRKTFETRSKIVSAIRHFFDDKGFLEVETPMMHPIAGGANAKPFVTHHNALGVERYMRIAPELYLKRLIVGGMEAVYEINRNFRNEGIDATHNPEFTSLEFYWAYKTYEDLMKLTEELFVALFAKLKLPKVLKFGEHQIDYSAPFARYTYKESLVQIGGIDKTIINDKEKIIAFLKENHIDVNEKLSIGHLQAELFDNFVEAKLINPTFITEYPVEISPLARRNDENPEIVDRFEFFIAGFEIANAFSELNDPVDQYERFKGQLDAKDAGDDEAHEMDEDYINALSYGMAPTAGQGIGIDRLVMLLTDNHSIRDVLLFPAMKPLPKEENKQEEEEN
jgi:lysyl-tRNA synthetase class 2